MAAVCVGRAEARAQIAVLRGPRCAAGRAGGHGHAVRAGADWCRSAAATHWQRDGPGAALLKFRPARVRDLPFLAVMLTFTLTGFFESGFDHL